MLLSQRSPFKVMATSASGSSPVSTSIEEAPLLRTWFSDHSSAACHPTITIVKVWQKRRSLLLRFLWLRQHVKRLILCWLPCEWTITSLTCKWVGNWEFKALVHNQGKQTSSVCGIVQTTMSATLPGETSLLHCLFQVASTTTKYLIKRNPQVDPSAKDSHSCLANNWKRKV